ncbi:hypothetical protein C8D76_103133 [Pasteurella langaaensis DSM 22999]|uniref:Uncharacterized protein n=1 Tax=Alitibacter langaaensis DSM 22999 TaxID=1122935 RepID=A0A2U0TAB0_9PAST|nr:hypothetical protein C8D76_103133 [Pasteurella langaaensis DSM 22999]
MTDQQFDRDTWQRSVSLDFIDDVCTAVQAEWING